MRKVKLLIAGLVALLVSGCVTQQPKPEAVVWTPSNPQTALVVFTDDYPADSLDRHSSLAQTLQQEALDQLSRYDYDTVEGRRLTQAFLNHPGRRSAQEIADSLAMLDGWGYAVAHAYALQQEDSGAYRKVSLQVSTTVYDVNKQRAIKRWDQTLSRHVVVASNCDRGCVEESVLPKANDLMADLAERTHAVISAYKQPAKSAAQPVAQPIAKPAPKPAPPAEEPPQVPGEKGQWNTINF